MRSDEPFPALPLEAWLDTKVTLHLFTQIIGKIRMTLTPKVNHWWHVPLYVSARGLTTGPIPYENRNFELELDLIDHHLAARTSSGESFQIPLEGQSVASFYQQTLDALSRIGIEVTILANPFDPERVKSREPFPEDTAHGTYVPEYAHRCWSILVPLDSIFKEFRGRFLGKCSPVHFFWHSFDLAVTRFSGRAAPVAEGTDLVTREAYSHEVISAGFWVGDDNVPEPSFYSYTAPEPKGLNEEPLRPAEASWNDQNGSSLALYRYNDFRASADPRRALLDFLQSSYEAGAKRANWPRNDQEV
jgi:hypothetical protein